MQTDEFASLRELIEKNPSFYVVAGGREAVERYLVEAEKSLTAGSSAPTDFAAKSRMAGRNEKPARG